MKNLSKSNRILAIAGIIIVVLGVIAAILDTSAVTDYGDDTPEGVVQRYIDAALDGNDAEADEFLAPALGAECANEDPFAFRIRDDGGVRVALDRSSIDGAEARVTVRVTEGSSGLFDSYQYAHEELFVLETIDGIWKINHQSWPRYGC